MAHAYQLHTPPPVAEPELIDDAVPAVQPWAGARRLAPVDRGSPIAIPPNELLATIGRLGEHFKQSRLATGIAQEILARPAGMTEQASSAHQAGARRTPAAGTIRSLAGALGLVQAERAILTVPPTPLTSLVGRTEEMERATALLLTDSVRLLTLTGPGGVGKTRLALALADTLRDAFPDGVAFVDLAPIPDARLVLAAIARAVGVSDGGDRAPLVAIRARLADCRLLLLLDTFEHVAGTALQVAELLATLPNLTILVTSRVRLRLRGEWTLRLASLAVPATDGAPIDGLVQVPAVALFVERARAADPTFALTPTTAWAIARLCRHLDGLPLAIEHAAAHAAVLTPGELLSAAERRLTGLGWEGPDLPARQQSLRATVAWSYDLLGPNERALFRRLAAFAGSWTLEAADSVARMGALGLDPLSAVARLVDASLVQVSPTEDDGPRFRLLRSLREFAAEQLEASGEGEATRRELVAYFAGVAESPAPAADPAARDAWLARLERDGDNLRAALAAATSVGDATAARRLAAGLAEPERVFAAERPAGVGTAAPSARPKGLLSPREQEVLRLLALGRTNKQIAEELLVAEVTARFHVGSLLNKLGADNRTQVVALALERRLL